MNRPLTSAWHPAKPFQVMDLLFDFEALPGRFPLTLREPRELFDNSRMVLMLSAGREVPGLALEPSRAQRAQRAASFFVRTAMFRPAADHYTLLGLQPGFGDDVLRDHYRLLMRMVHPDFEGSSAWPRDAAARINLATDVLGSKVRRTEYDQSLARGQRQKLGVNSLAAVLPRPALQRATPVKLWAWSAGTAVAVFLGAVVMYPSDSQESVQALLVPVPVSAPVVFPRPDLTSSSPAVVQSMPPPPPPLAMALQPPAIAAPESTAPPLSLAISTQMAPMPGRKVDALPASPTKVPALSVAETAQIKPPSSPLLIAQASAPVITPAKTGTTAAPVVPAVPALSVAPVAAAVASLAPMPITALPPARETTPPLSLADAQTALSQLINNMQSGRGEALLVGLDRAVRQSSGAAELVLAYNYLVGNSRAIKLGPVQLNSRPLADQLVVEGNVQLLLQDQGQPPPVRELRLRALFAQRGGQVVMTELSAGGARP